MHAPRVGDGAATPGRRSFGGSVYQVWDRPPSRAHACGGRPTRPMGDKFDAQRRGFSSALVARYAAHVPGAQIGDAAPPSQGLFLAHALDSPRCCRMSLSRTSNAPSHVPVSQSQEDYFLK
ncbi:hypothetical protein D9611_010671 [Ephemerocybe angulata]|uniref:Uncharacterized protein n=1 Tax=Ephemerocybe angulata TaxID=980116 RepID=A0A8H5F1W7_9AGAR|nr:hypothetical protein D9611_010671 [Tulosesus angulatus]